MTTIMERTRYLHFAEPLPGFPGEEEYTLSPIDEQGVLYSLRAVHEPGLRFVLTAPEAFFADYHPDIADALAPVLGDDDDVSLLVMLTLGAGLADATANLRAPIAVSAGSGRAVQVVLDDETLPMREPLVQA
jgi:flagellar assembly factor FliW